MRDVSLSTKSYTVQAPLLGHRFWQYVQRVLGYAAMFAVVLIIGIPVAWVLSGALKTNREIFSITPQLLPANPNFDNFVKAWQAAPFDRFYLNSFITTLLGAGAEIIMALSTAYALVFVRFPKRDWIFYLLLLSRRKLLKGMGIGAGALALAACAVPQAPAQPAAPAAGEPTAAPAPTTAPAATGPVELIYWGFSGGLGKTEEKLIAMWNEKQSEVKVTPQVQGNYEETAQKLTAALAAQQGPDMVLLSDVWWFKFYRAKALMPLNELIKEQQMDTADFVESLWNEGVRKGVQYWIPFARSTPLFYYNADMLEAAGLPVRGPETWDEMREWAPKLVKKEGDTMKVAAFAHPGAASYVAWLFQCVIRQFGGRYSDQDFNIKLTEPDSIRAGQFYQDTVNKEGWAIASKDVTKDFVTGLAATAMLSTGALAGVLREAQFKVGTAFLPKEKLFNCCTGGSGLAILATTPMEKARAAMKYIDYATGNEGGAFWPQNTGYMPVRKSTAKSESYQKFFEQVPQARTAVEQLPLTEAQDAARVFIPGGDQIIGKGLERILIGNEPVEQVFAEVKATLEQEAEPVKRDLAALG